MQEWSRFLHSNTGIRPKLREDPAGRERRGSHAGPICWESMTVAKKTPSPRASFLLVGRGGFEPPLTGPEPAVLPLDDLPRVATMVRKPARAVKIRLAYIILDRYNRGQ